MSGAVMNEDTMDCPGCGKPNVSRALVACPPCWFSLPSELKAAVYAFKIGTVGRMRAVGVCRNWLKEHAR